MLTTDDAQESVSQSADSLLEKDTLFASEKSVLLSNDDGLSFFSSSSLKWNKIIIIYNIMINYLLNSKWFFFFFNIK